MPEPREPRSIIELAEQAAAAGNYASAEELLREAALVQEASLGPLHPDLANTLNNLGVVCEITGNGVDAEHCFRRAFTIATAALEPDHPFVATSRKNLRDFCEARENYHCSNRRCSQNRTSYSRSYERDLFAHSRLAPWALSQY